MLGIVGGKSGEMQACDWLCPFQNVDPADGCFVTIGSLSSSSGAFGHFRLRDGVDTKKERRKTGKYLSWTEQWKLNINRQICMKRLSTRPRH